MVTKRDLILWASQEIHDEILIFDKILDIYDQIEHFLKNNSLNLNCEKQIFLMHLFLFLYKNSDKSINFK